MEFDINIEIEILKGKTLKKVEKVDKKPINDHDDEIHFTVTDEEKYKLYHFQNCCEDVYIESIVGDLDDLVGSPILAAECVTNSEENVKDKDGYIDESVTWSFYKLATIKGSVTIRWFGTSNGYYSETVDFIKE